MRLQGWTARRWVLAAIAVVVVVLVVIAGWTFVDAWQAGVLPWQPEPTRAAITPFANLPTPASTP